MRLLTTYEIHAVEAQGRFYNPDGVINYSALCNYRYMINDILVVVRCTKNSSVRQQWLRIDGEGVKAGPIPEPVSVFGLLRLLPRIIGKLIGYVKNCDRYIVRLPGPTGTIVGIVLCFLGKRYGVEFVGHASESIVYTRRHSQLMRACGFASHVVTRLLRSLKDRFIFHLHKR